MKVKALLVIVIVLLVTTSCSRVVDSDEVTVSDENILLEVEESKESDDIILEDKSNDISSENNEKEIISATEIFEELDKRSVYEFLINKESTSISFENIFDSSVEGNLIINTKLGKDDYGFDMLESCEIRFASNSLVFEVEKTLYGSGITSISIIDLDKNDARYEIVITEDELADRMVNSIYRVSSEGIEFVDKFNGMIVNVSAQNKVYYWGGNVYEPYYRENFMEELVVSYRDVIKREYIYIDDVIGKSITIDRSLKVFTSKEDVETGAPVEQTDEGLLIEIASGSKIKVLEITADDLYKIELEDATVGYIGGFHMVWD